MASRPAKRQRRSTVIHSDDENTDPKPPTPQKRRLTKASATSSPISSPDKIRKAPKKAEAPNKSLHSFFGRATEEQRWKRDSATPEVVSEDWIEDEISDDDYVNGDSATSAAVGSTYPSRLKQELSSSQKFVKPAAPNRSAVVRPLGAALQTGEVEEHRPWADRYGPENLEELAVHKKKVGDVQKWLEDTLSGRERKRLLILKGPAGSGKTSTITLLARNLGLEVVSWHNSTVSEAGILSNVQQFSDFLNRGGGFGSLSFQDDHISVTGGPESSSRILLIEEFPTVTNRSSNISNTFRSALLQYLASSSQSPQLGKVNFSSYPPVIMLISETLLSSSTSLNDSFTAHRLLGPDISNHPMTAMMEFNPVAPTFLQKALDLVIKKEARNSKRRRAPGPQVLQKLAEIGDLRSAINSLEFLCARGDEDSDWSGTVAGRAKKKDLPALTEMEKTALQLVSQRESTLDMFHAAGKIVYNKREDPRVMDSRAEPPPKPPDHLLYLYTSKVSQVDIDALLSETGTDIQTFISTLHENYVLSCNGDDFVDSLEGCSRILSDSDILNPENRNLVRGRGAANVTANFTQSGNSDMLRQDEISFQTASLGLLFNLPFPVSRAIPPGARKQDAFKMFYPGSLRLWKPTEEIHDLITMYISAEQGPSSPGSKDSSRDHTVNGVSSWKSRGFGLQGIPAEAQQSPSNEGDLTPSTLKAVTSRDNYVVEILPYMTKIRSATVQSQSQSQNAHQVQDLQNLKKITQLRGVDLVSTQEPDVHEDEDKAEAETTAPGPTPRSAARMSFGQKIQAAHDSIRSGGTVSEPDSTGPGGGMGDSQTSRMEKLYISDDDISD